MKRIAILAAALCALAVTSAPSQGPVPKYARGLKFPANLQVLKQQSALRHNLAALPAATEAHWDSRAKGWVGPIKNQRDCGGCWDFAGTGAVEASAVKGGHGKAGEFVLSEQYTISCYRNGGCDGDFPSTVLEHAKKVGLPFDKDYGPYFAREVRCKDTSGMKFFKIQDWGFCTPDSNGIARTQDIKNCIKAYGAVAVAVAANRTWDGYRGGVHHGGDMGINHAVILVGWDDDPAIREGGSWIMRNSWGKEWGEEGYMHIAYGADGIGTEAMFAVVESVEPPPAPPAPPAPVFDVRVSLKEALAIVAVAAVLVAVIVYFARRKKGA